MQRCGRSVVMALVLGTLWLAHSNAQSLGQESLQGDEDALASVMAEQIRQVGRKRHPEGLMRRFNQIKSLGCFDGTFTVNDGLDEWLRQGLFSQPASYPVSLRFANASKMDDSEKDLRGLSLRVSRVPGEVIWGERGKQDFVLNSYPVLFAATPEEFLAFIHAQKNDSLLRFFLHPFDSHLKALWILLQARDRPNSPFDIRYWSTTPYRYGEEQAAVKYSVAPCSDYRSDAPEQYTQNYLRAAMSRHLDAAPVCLDFMVQFQTDAEAMPIEDPSVEWDEAESPFIPVARITFEQQSFMPAEAISACEAKTFNPWQSLAAHRPLGRMNYVRRQIYAELAAFRERANRQKLQ